MRIRSCTLVALAALATLPAAAAAAPNRQGALDAVGSTFEWSSDVATGAVYTSDVSSRVPACSPIFSCDATLIKTGTLGDLQVAITGVGVGGQDTLKDADLHVYASDPQGTQGDLLAESVGATATEGVDVADAPAGYYLVYVDWYLGVGSVDGTATLAAPTPDEEL